MDTPQDFSNDTGQATGQAAERERIVYVRPVDVEDLPEQVRAQVAGTRNIYAVHAENGDRLALVNGCRLAFVLARQNDLKPVHVH